MCEHKDADQENRKRGRIYTLSSTDSNKSMSNTYSSNHSFQSSSLLSPSPRFSSYHMIPTIYLYSHMLPVPTILCLINISHPATCIKTCEQSFRTLSLFVIRIEYLFADVKCYC